MQLREGVTTGKTTTVLMICESRSPSGDVHLLVVHNSPSDRKPEGWGLPGGGTREGEHTALTAVRELREETGVRLPQRYRLELVNSSEVSPSHTRVVYKLSGWLPFVGGSFPIDDPGRGVTEACWVSYHEIHKAWKALQSGFPAVDPDSGRQYYNSHLRLLYGNPF